MLTCCQQIARKSERPFGLRSVAQSDLVLGMSKTKPRYAWGGARDRWGASIRLGNLSWVKKMECIEILMATGWISQFWGQAKAPDQWPSAVLGPFESVPPSEHHVETGF